MNILIVGGGKVGTNLAHILQEHGHVVILIEQDEQIAVRRARSYAASLSFMATVVIPKYCAMPNIC